MRRCLPRTRREAAGAGLIEVLIAVLVMGIGLLGIAALQATSLRNNQSAQGRSAAVIQSYAILDAMRANREGARSGQYNTDYICAAPSGDSLATRDLASWIAALGEALPGGEDSTCGRVACSAELDCEVAVRWDDSRGSDGSAVQEFVSRTRL